MYIRGGQGGATGIEVTKKIKGNGGKIENVAKSAVDEVLSSRARRVWLFLVGLLMFHPPPPSYFALIYSGCMKQADIRLARREKLTI